MAIGVTSKFALKAEDLEKFETLISQLKEEAEITINDVMHSKAKDLLVTSITNFLPVSDRKKTHAKNSKWYKTKDINLGVQIDNASNFYYLFFPLTASGTSRGKEPNDFINKGFDESYLEIMNMLQDALINKINQK